MRLAHSVIFFCCLMTRTAKFEREVHCPLNSITVRSQIIGSIVTEHPSTLRTFADFSSNIYERQVP